MTRDAWKPPPPTGGPLIEPIPAIRTKDGVMSKGRPEPVAIVGFAGNKVAVVATREGRLETVGFHELLIAGDAVRSAIDQAEALIAGRDG